MIYFVEDDNSIRKLVLYSLTSAGLEAEGFPRPSEFWAAMERRLPQVVLLDIMLPEEDGISILKKLRADSRTRGIQVILLTGLVGQDTILMKEQGIVDEIVLKPIRFKELLDVMEQMTSEKDEEGDDGKGFRKNEGQAADRADPDGDSDFSDWL